MKFTLKPYQRFGVDQMKKYKRFLVGDGMGVGKMVQGIEAIRELGEGCEKFNTLIICPPSVVLLWCSELSKAFPGSQVVEIKNEKSLVSLKGKYRFVVAGWPYIRKSSERLSKVKWHVIIGDEFQACINPKSQTTIGWFNIIKNTSGYIWPMTGTPIKTKGEQYWPVLETLTPGKWGSYSQFKWNYCIKEENYWGVKFTGIKKDKAGVLAKAFKELSIQRLLSDVEKDMPPETFQNIYLDLNYKSSFGTAIDPVTGLFTGSVAELHSERQRIGAAKIDQAAEFILTIGRPVVVFCAHKHVVKGLDEKLSKAGKTVSRITGDESREKKFLNVNDFQAGKTDVVLVNHEAGGTGVNLTRSHDVVFVEFPASPEDYKQCKGRVRRHGQESKAIFIYNLIVKNSWDEDRIKNLKERAAFIQDVRQDNQELGL